MWKPILIFCFAIFIANYDYLVGPQGHSHPLELTIGNYSDTPFGKTRYILSGPSNAKELIVFVHGFSDYSMIWNWYTQQLSNHYQVLVYDLYGRGYSEAAKNTKHDDRLFVTQLSSLLHFLNLGNEPFTLVGLSMGGAIAGSYASTFPHKVKNLILLAPAGFPINTPFAGYFAKIPYLGDFAMKLFGRNILLGRAPTAFPDREKYKDCIQEITEMYLFQIDHHPEYFHSLIASLRDFPFGSLQPKFEKLSRDVNMKIDIVWGEKDLTVPFDNAKHFKETIPHANLVIVSDSGHAIEFQARDQVFQVIKNALER